MGTAVTGFPLAASRRWTCAKAVLSHAVVSDSKSNRGDVPLRQPRLRTPGRHRLSPNVFKSDGTEIRHQNPGPRTGMRAVRFAGRPRLFRRDEMRTEHVVCEPAGDSSSDSRSF